MTPSAPELESGWIESIRLRRKALLMRVGLVATSALVYSPILGWRTVTAWALLNLVLQCLELVAFGPINAGRTGDMGRFRSAVGASLMTLNAVAFVSLAPVLWLMAGVTGGVCATILLAAAAMFAVVNSPRSRTVLACSLTPSLTLMALTPLLLSQSGADGALVTAAIVAVLSYSAYCLGVWQRLTDAREAEVEARLEVERKRNEAEAAMTGRNGFLAAVSHDLRTPISAILAGAMELRRTGQDAGARGQAELIVDAGLMMKALLDDLLDHSKLEAGRMTVDAGDFDLRAMVHQTWALWRGAAAEKHLRLRIEGARSLPRHVQGDPVRLRQVLNNLLSNALKFTDSGSITLRLKAWVDEADSHALLIDVVDTGPGMRNDQLKRLFEPFDQTQDGVSARHGGTGLGLAISRDLVDLMGGRLTAWSRPGEGAVFTVALRLTRGSAQAAEVKPVDEIGRGLVARALAPTPIRAVTPTPQPQDQPVTAGPTMDSADVETGEADDDRPLRILVVDDHDINRRAVELILAPVDCEVSMAADGLVALALCEANAFDVVFMDVRMPELDGRETTRRLRAGGGVNANVPVIAVTADTAPEDIAACMASGMTYFVSKPLTPASLLGALQHVLSAPAEDVLQAEADAA